MARVTFAVGLGSRRSCLVLVVSKPRWPRCAVVPNLHLHHQRTPSSVINYIYLNRAYLNVSACVMHTYGLYLVHMVCNNTPRDIPEHDPLRMYIHTL